MIDTTTIDGVAASMEVSTRTVRRWIAEGQLPAYRVGKRAIRIRVADVESMMQRIQVGAL